MPDELPDYLKKLIGEADHKMKAEDLSPGSAAHSIATAYDLSWDDSPTPAEILGDIQKFGELDAADGNLEPYRPPRRDDDWNYAEETIEAIMYISLEQFLKAHLEGIGPSPNNPVERGHLVFERGTPAQVLNHIKNLLESEDTFETHWESAPTLDGKDDVLVVSQVGRLSAEENNEE